MGQRATTETDDPTDSDLDEEPDAPIKGKQPESESELEKLRQQNSQLLDELKRARTRERDSLIAEYPGLTKEDLGNLDVAKLRSVLSKVKGGGAPKAEDPDDESEETGAKSPDAAVASAKEFVKGARTLEKGAPTGSAKQAGAKDLFQQYRSGEITLAELKEAQRQKRLERRQRRE